MKHCCPACGYPGLWEPPRSAAAGGASNEICVSCGFQFGFTDDVEGYSYETWRRKWVSAGMPWSSVGVPRPRDWNPHNQLRVFLAKATGLMPTPNVSELVQQYRHAAAQHRAATEAGDPAHANRSANRVAALYRELRAEGLPAQTALLTLLNDSDPGVQAWTAAHALEFAPEAGEQVLQRLIAVGGLVGLTAETTLNEWRAGRLRFV